MHTPLYVYMYVRTHVCICLLRSEVSVDCVPLQFSTLFIESGCLCTRNSKAQKDWPAGTLPSLPPQPQISQVHGATPTFYMHTGDSRSSLDCTVSTLPTEPSPQPSFRVLKQGLPV